jgi:hypothetical protein
VGWGLFQMDLSEPLTAITSLICWKLCSLISSDLFQGG